MGHISHRNRSSLVLGVLYTCSLLQHVDCKPTSKQPSIFNSNGASFTFNLSQDALNGRNRRKLSNGSGDQEINSLDESGLQYQEYQGVFGRPGIDFPVLQRIPITKFSCRDIKNNNMGYYADIDTNCQVFHVCNGGQKVSFLCPNGTIFRQSHLICDWWFKVECQRSPDQYEESVQHLKTDQNLYKQRANTIQNAMQDALANGDQGLMLLESPVSITNENKILNSKFQSESDLPQSYNTALNSQNINIHNIHFQDDSYTGSSSSAERPFQYFSEKPRTTEAVNKDFNDGPTPKPVLRSRIKDFFDSLDQLNYDHQQEQKNATGLLDNFNSLNLHSENRQKLEVEDAVNTPSSPSKYSETPKEQTKVNLQQKTYFIDKNVPSESFQFLTPQQNLNISHQQSSDQFLPPDLFDGFGQQQNLVQQRFEENVAGSESNSISPDTPLEVVQSYNPQTTINIVQQQHPIPNNAPGIHSPTSEVFQTIPQLRNSKDQNVKSYSIGVDLEPPNKPSQYYQPPYPNFNFQKFPSLFSQNDPTTTTSKNIQFSTWSIPQTTFHQTTFKTPVTFTQEHSTLAEINVPKNTFTFDPSNKAAKFFTFRQTPASNFPSTAHRSTVSVTLPPLITRVNYETTVKPTGSLTPSSTESITNFVKSYFENQVPAESAGFTNDGKYQSMQNLYYSQNKFWTDSKSNVKPVQTTTSSAWTKSSTPSEPTTFNLYNSLFDNSPSNVSDSFALFYGNTIDLSSLTTQTEENLTLKSIVSELVKTTEPPIANTLPILLTNQTKDSYNQLFSKDAETTAMSFNPSSSLISSNTESIYEKLNLNNSANFRELAQIFSRALSAYLDDPEQFRKILLEVRPTEPPHAKNKDFEDESLSFSDIKQTTTRPAKAGNIETFAEEVNNFMFANIFQSHTNDNEFNINDTYYPGLYNSKPTTPITMSIAPIINLTKTPTLVNPNPNVQKWKVHSLLDESPSPSTITPDILHKLPTSGYFSTQTPTFTTKSASKQFSFQTTPSISSQGDGSTYWNIQTSPTTPPTLDNSFATTFSNSPGSMQPILNGRTVATMMNILEDAKIDAELRHKLVLLLVNDHSDLPYNSQSYNEMKSKLLKALGVSASANDHHYKNSVSERKADVEGLAPQTASTRGHAKYKLSAITNSDYLLSSLLSSVSPSPRPSRSTLSGNSHAMQVQPIGLDDTDLRAIDLLKTLYAINSRH